MLFSHVNPVSESFDRGLIVAKIHLMELDCALGSETKVFVLVRSIYDWHSLAALTAAHDSNLVI